MWSCARGPLPQITGQPVKQVAEPGNCDFFGGRCRCPCTTFQWQFNGTDIPGATGDSLLLTGVSAANEGQYSVVVTNSAGSVTSTPAALLLDSDGALGDSDGDGLPDTWERANFTDPDPTRPLNPANQRSGTDGDKDGISNLEDPYARQHKPRIGRFLSANPGWSPTAMPAVR